MLILTMTGILLVLLVIAAIVQDKADFRKHQQMVARFGALPGFTPTQYLVGCDAATGVAIDETRRKLGFLVRCGEQFFEQILSYDDVLAVEIFQDGVSVTRTGQTSQVDGAGIDPVTRRSRTADKVERVTVRITVNDRAAPLRDISLLNVGCRKEHRVYLQVMERASHWHGVLEALSRRAELQASGILTGEEFGQQKAKLAGTA